MMKHTQPVYSPLSGTTRVSRYQKKHSPSHHPDHHPTFISFFYLLRSIASCVLRNLFAQPLSMSSLFYLLVWSPPPHIPYISLPTQSVSSFRNTCPYQRQSTERKTTQHRTAVTFIFSLIVQTIIIAQMLSAGREGL